MLKVARHYGCRAGTFIGSSCFCYTTFKMLVGSALFPVSAPPAPLHPSPSYLLAKFIDCSVCVVKGQPDKVQC